MILGIGCDIIKISRIQVIIEKMGIKFLSRVYTPEEISIGLNLFKEKSYAYFAKRFAAKEAISKALGTGIGGAVSFLDIEITNNPNGRPVGRLKPEKFSKLILHLTLADEDDCAVAYAIIEGEALKI